MDSQMASAQRQGRVMDIDSIVRNGLLALPLIQQERKNQGARRDHRAAQRASRVISRATDSRNSPIQSL
jgi:hypothetical protein